MLEILKENKILSIIVTILSIMTMTPLMNIRFSPVIHIALWCIFFVYYFIVVKPDINKDERQIIAVALLYLVLIFSYKFGGISSAEWGNYLNQIRFFTPLFISFAIFSRCDKTQLRVIFHAALLICMYNVIDSIRICMAYPGVPYQELSEVADEAGLKLNVGNSPFMNMTIILLNVTVYGFYFSAKKFEKLVFGGYSLIILYFIVFCTFKASVLIYAILSVVLLLISKRAENPVKFVIISSFVGLILSLFIEPIIYFLVDTINSQRISERLLIFVTDDNDVANKRALTGRENLYLLSLKTWMEDISNFFLGIGDHRTSYGAMEIGIGQHSDFCDTFARYGILGASIVFAFFKKSFSWFLDFADETDNKKKAAIMSVIFVVIMCGTTKNLFYPNMGFTLFFLLPLVISITSDTKDVEE